MKQCGIYIIEDKQTGSIYIGQSIDIARRISQHKRELENNIHSNTRLQNIFNKRRDALGWYILLTCEPEQLTANEQQAIIANGLADGEKIINIHWNVVRTHLGKKRPEQSIFTKAQWNDPEFRQFHADRIKGKNNPQYHPRVLAKREAAKQQAQQKKFVSECETQIKKNFITSLMTQWQREWEANYIKPGMKCYTRPSKKKQGRPRTKERKMRMSSENLQSMYEYAGKLTKDFLKLYADELRVTPMKDFWTTERKEEFRLFRGNKIEEYKAQLLSKQQQLVSC